MPSTPESKRTVLVHLNVEPAGDDARNADDIADAIMAALEVGSDDDSVRGLAVSVTLAEEL